jgi:hypothetical protein
MLATHSIVPRAGPLLRVFRARPQRDLAGGLALGQVLVLDKEKVKEKFFVGP